MALRDWFSRRSDSRCAAPAFQPMDVVKSPASPGMKGRDRHGRRCRHRPDSRCGILGKPKSDNRGLIGTGSARSGTFAMPTRQ